MALFETKKKYQSVVEKRFPRGKHLCSLYAIIVSREYIKDEGSGVQVNAGISVFLSEEDTRVSGARDYSAAIYRLVRVVKIPSSRADRLEGISSLYAEVEFDIVREALVSDGASEKAIKEAEKYFLGGDK